MGFHTTQPMTKLVLVPQTPQVLAVTDQYTTSTWLHRNVPFLAAGTGQLRGNFMSIVPPKFLSLLMVRNISFIACGYFNSLD